MRVLAAAVVLLAAGCATQQEATPEQYICADPENRAEKGGQQACEAFYLRYRIGGKDPCAGLTTLECVRTIEGLESAGFGPRTVSTLCTDEEIAAYRAETGSGLNDASLRAACEAQKAMTPPQSPNPIVPLQGEVLVGAVPLKGATHSMNLETEMIDGRRTAKIRAEKTLLVDLSQSADKVSVRFETTKSDVELSRMPANVQSILEESADREIGQVEEFTFSPEDPITSRTNLWKALASISYLGGRSVRQGQEVRKYDFAELLPLLDSKRGQGSVSSRVIGQSVIDNRAVIVASAQGSMPNGAGGTVSIERIDFFDLETGYIVRGETRLAGFRDNDGILSNITETRYTKFN